MKKAFIHFSVKKNNSRDPHFIFIYDNGEVKIVGDQSTIGGSIIAASMKNRFASLNGIDEREKEAKLIFDDYTKATPGYAAQYVVVDYSGEDKTMADNFFDALSEKNFDLAKEKQNG
jgi:hypothetical protein